MSKTTMYSILGMAIGSTIGRIMYTEYNIFGG